MSISKEIELERIEEEQQKKAEIIHKYTTILENTKAKVKAMQDELAQSIKIREQELKQNQEQMSKVIATQKEEERKQIAEELQTVFTLNKNTEQSAMHLRTFTDLKELGIMQLENTFHQKQRNTTAKHKERLEKITKHYENIVEEKNKQIKVFKNS